MTRIYLITGFLGAGKTTFLKEFVRIFDGKKISVIVNEFGKAGVDGALLSDLALTLAEIDNGSIFCVCQLPNFERTLAAQLEEEPDVIVVEASGLADPTSVGGILSDSEKFPTAEYAGAICLVDGARFCKLYETARVVKRQLAVSDVAVINKTDIAREEELDFIEKEIYGMRPDMTVFRTSFGRIGEEVVDAIRSPSATRKNNQPHIADITLQKLSVRIGGGFTKDTLEKFVAQFAEETYRVKGFVFVEGDVLLVNSVGPLVNVDNYTGAIDNLGVLTVLYGNGLRARKALKEAIGWYPNCEVEILKP